MKENELKILVQDISKSLQKLESIFFNVYVDPRESYYVDANGQIVIDEDREDDKTFLFHGTRQLFYKICLFLELKEVPIYLKSFYNKFYNIIDDENEVTKDRPGLYSEWEPSMIILDEFGMFLNSFPEFQNDFFSNKELNKLKLILENTSLILNWTKTQVTNETSIYTPVKHFVEVVFPTTRNSGKAAFITKFKTYQPDILIPEINSAVEYKYIRAGANVATYLDQLKTDADVYVGDSNYRFFYAVVVFENKGQLNPQSFKQAVREKLFPENWIIMAL